jgi:hypothetical protein
LFVFFFFFQKTSAIFLLNCHVFCTLFKQASSQYYKKDFNKFLLS